MVKDGGSGRPTETGAYRKATDPYRAVYAVAGSSGQVSGGSLNHPVMYVSLNNLGSMVIDVDGDRLDATFLRENGVVADSFTIDKTPAPNVAPAVSLTQPAAGASFSAPATIALAANASDTDGSVVKVEFLNGATVVGTATAAPYAAAWGGVAAGSYVLTARATDDDGAVTTSAAVTVKVNAPAPAAPTGLAAKAISKTRIDLAWNDNAVGETGFKIERSTDGKRYTIAATNVPVSIRSGMTAWVAPCSRSTPSTTMRSVPAPEIFAPIAPRQRARSTISGSRAAFSSVVVPEASVAAIIRFSVPVTVTTSNTKRVPDSRRARALM